MKTNKKQIDQSAFEDWAFEAIGKAQSAAEFDRTCKAKLKMVEVVNEDGEPIDATIVVNTLKEGMYDDEKMDEEEKAEDEADDKMDEEEQKSLVDMLGKSMDARIKELRRETDARIKRFTVTGGDVRNDDVNKGGFHSFGHFAKSVKNFRAGEIDRDSRQKLLGINGHSDSDLRVKVSGTAGSSAVGADGGFLIPQDFRAELTRWIFTQNSLSERCRRMETASNSVTIPGSTETPWGTDGLRHYWVGEGDQITGSKANYIENEVKLHKVAVLARVTNEQLDDSAINLNSWLPELAGERIRYAVDKAIMDGNGSTQPIGIRQSGAIKQTTRSAAVGIDVTDIANLIAGQNPGGIANCTFVSHTTVIPDIITAAVSNDSVFFGANTIRDTPTMATSLLGLPLIYHEAAQARDTAGDLSLHDFSQYLLVTKTGDDTIRSDLSMHMYFDLDQSAFRFIFRVGGQPWFTAPYSQDNGSGTLSSFVEVGAT